MILKYSPILFVTGSIYKVVGMVVEFTMCSGKKFLNVICREV